MKGLEVAEVNKSALNDEARYESEFFQKRFIAEDNALASFSRRKISEFAAVTDGPHGYHIVDKKSPVVMLTAKNAVDWFAERAGADPIAEQTHLQNRRSSLGIGDVILSTRGTVGRCALVTEEALPANIDQDVARISWDNRNEFVPEFLVAYLNSKYGQDHIVRHSSGMVQQGMSLQKVRDIPVPSLSLNVQEAVAETVRQALDERRRSSREYTRAETLLLTALNLQNWNPPQPLAYEAPSAAAFLAGRLDAEHFQPQYAALFDRMGQAASKKGWTVEKLGDLSAPLKYGTSTELTYVEQGIPFLRIADVRHYTFSPETLKYISEAAAAQEQTALVQTNDVLISRSGTLGLAVAISQELNNAVFGSYFIRIRPNKRLLPGFLSLFVNSIVGRMQIEQLNTGGIQTNLTIPAIESLRIAIPSISEQEEFVAYMQASHDARRRAKGLLEAAKRAVEIAIEDSEAAGLRVLEEAGAA